MKLRPLALGSSVRIYSEVSTGLLAFCSFCSFCSISRHTAGALLLLALAAAFSIMMKGPRTPRRAMFDATRVGRPKQAMNFQLRAL
eukprot:g9710.t1